MQAKAMYYKHTYVFIRVHTVPCTSYKIPLCTGLHTCLPSAYIQGSVLHADARTRQDGTFVF